MDQADQQRLARYNELKPRRVAELSDAEFAERHELRLWIASTHEFPAAAPQRAEPGGLAASYMDGKYAGMLVLDGPHFKITPVRPNRDGTATAWRVKRSKIHSQPSRTRGARPTRSHTTRARAKALTRSSSRSGDSGSDDPHPEGDPEGSEPSSDAGRRFCACGCGLSLDEEQRGRKFVDGTHRVRAHRHPGPKRGQEADPYLKLSGWERDALQQRAEEACRCNGHHILAIEDGDCVKCGRPYRDDIAPYYVELWRRREKLPSYVRAVAYDREHGVAA